MKILPFLKTAARDPKIGAVMPSSRYAAAKIVRNVPHGVRRVLEYGPGDGVLTRRLLEMLPPDGRLVAFETNAEFRRLLGEIADPRFRLEDGDARAAASRLVDGDAPFDLAVSGIPFSMMSSADRTRTVAMTWDLLRPGGVFIVYQTSPLMYPYLKRTFDVRLSVELRNVPPYFIMRAEKRR